MTPFTKDSSIEFSRWPSRYGVGSLYVSIGGLIVASFATLLSISPHLFLLQFVWVSIGVGIVVLLLFLDWRRVAVRKPIIWGLYGGAVVLLVAAYLQGHVVRGTRSWLDLGPFNLQPVELAKVALILLFAHYFSRAHVGVARLRHMVISFALFALPAALTILQPDLGSALILFGTWFSFLVLSGLPRRQTIGVVLAIAAVFAAMWFFGFKDYQRDRIVGVLYPERDVLGINYSVAQSKIAIGSGGFLGKGFGQGTQTQLDFLPEPATDFAFSAFVEEWGFLGGVLVLVLFLYLIVTILRVGLAADGNFEKLVCLGGVAVLGLQFSVNMGSALGLLPVVGVTFPFLSYGGSSMVANFFIIGLIHAIGRRG